MSLPIMDNFLYLGKKFLDNRQSFDTIAQRDLCDDVPDGFITYVKETGKRYEFMNGQWQDYVSGSGGGVNAVISDTPPEDLEALWFINSLVEVISSSNPIIDELTDTIKSLNERILQLEARVAYLELYGGGNISDPDNPPTSSKDAILLEDGGYLLLEDGGRLLLETSSSSIDNFLLLEDGGHMLLEDGGKIKLEGVI